MNIHHALGIAAFAVLAGCAPAQPLPEQSPTPPSADTARKGYSAADVAFMRGMIGHHRQALAMAELVPARTSRHDFALMAERITLSQQSEIEQMQRWLQTRGEAVPAEDAHAAMGHGDLMPGMLTGAEMSELESARGVEFEKRFLELMIKHHQGALQMVKELFATPGSGQEPELLILAADVDADQNAEIKRMRALVAQLQ